MKQIFFLSTAKKLSAFMVCLFVLLCSYQINIASEKNTLLHKKFVNQELRTLNYKSFNPRFNDLYIIESQTKHRDVVVYCNSAYCYKKRFEKLAV